MRRRRLSRIRWRCNSKCGGGCSKHRTSHTCGGPRHQKPLSRSSRGHPRSPAPSSPGIARPLRCVDYARFFRFHSGFHTLAVVHPPLHQALQHPCATLPGGTTTGTGPGRHTDRAKARLPAGTMWLHSVPNQQWGDGAGVAAWTSRFSARCGCGMMINKFRSPRPCPACCSGSCSPGRTHRCR